MIILLLILSALNLVVLILLILKVYIKDNSTNLNKKLDIIERDLEQSRKIILDDLSRVSEQLINNISVFKDNSSAQILQLIQVNEQKFDKIKETIDKNLKEIRDDNNQKLERMRETVDEKLHLTLEKRLGESFQIVSQRLKEVHEGLGSMQTLAVGVGDLKKVLTNVKTRGTWGEIQLELLLEQLLTKDQYDKNVCTKKGSSQPVEFAIKLPGKEGSIVYIPIDSKFPKEDYERLLIAQDESNIPLIEEYRKAIERRIKDEAKAIKDKYIDPPHTTDFGILYLPIEGLYAEVLRLPGLCEYIQRETRVTLAGPTTITAVLNALQMGFRTLAVEKRASEVWNLLGIVKKEFGKFGDILDKTQVKLKQASNEIEFAAKKSRTIEKKLNKVQGNEVLIDDENVDNSLIEPETNLLKDEII